MPDVQRGAPARPNFAMVRRDWSPNYRYTEAIYGETKRSRSVSYPEGLELPVTRRDFFPKNGNRDVCMIFPNSRHLRSRLVKLGWIDVTAEWKAHHGIGNGDTIPVIEDGKLGEPIDAVTDAGATRPSGRHANAA